MKAGKWHRQASARQDVEAQVNTLNGPARALLTFVTKEEIPKWLDVEMTPEEARILARRLLTAVENAK
jgi:hypothetical protein